ncbi:YggS family pyridoxal phosphate-dependent enzyme [Aureibaculum luteum]|uniref:YggS family pyridoxal phosphate-dependent enzyme n=1 Tax=Aureibaculum luteum TaxID=1548456 RepID=UPI000E5097FF|nr:YggS family pyridoxal phosphate-dependent enzyme [Aureibaculum luteum]
MSISENLKKIKLSLPSNVELVAVSKTKPNSAILEAYSTGQRIFGENRIQEMVDKYDALPKDIEWHMIGHLQRNKVKYMAHFVNLIHGVDSLKTLQEINKQAKKHNRVIHCLLQARIAEEDTKFGLPFTEIEEILSSKELETLENISITGLMGMATFTDNIEQVKGEFTKINTLFKKLKTDHKAFTSLSIGMSGDYKLAIECGSTMVRVGSAIFGTRN